MKEPDVNLDRLQHIEDEALASGEGHPVGPFLVAPNKVELKDGDVLQAGRIPNQCLAENNTGRLVEFFGDVRNRGQHPSTHSRTWLTGHR